MFPAPHRFPKLALLSTALLLLLGACGPDLEGTEGETGTSEAAIGETGTYLTSVAWGSTSRYVSQAYNDYWAGNYSYATGVCMQLDHHPGIDVSMPSGTPIYAAAAGTVRQVGCDLFFRPMPVYVDADNGELHIYGHLRSNTVVAGQRVTRGQLVGYSGEQTVSGSCSTPDGSGAHLHFERRTAAGCAIDPVPVLTGGPTPPPTSFSVGDKIQVADGPLNVRSQPGVSGGLVGELATGTQMCVTGGPQSADGYTWYQINASGTVGWIAGNFCTLVAAGGCGSSTGPTPIPSSGWVVGDVLYTNDIGVRLRASPSTTGTIIHDSLPNGTKGVMVGGPVSADGYTWYQWDTRYGRGWSASTWMAETTAYTNRIANPTADSSLTSIAANQTSTTLSRVTVNNNYVVKVVNAGTTTTEGVRYDSASLSLTGARYISGVVDVYGSGTLDYVRVRISYTDGTSTWGQVAPAMTLSSGTWKRIVMPMTTATSTKTISKIYVYAVKNTAVGAMTYWVDNAKAIEL
jgi:Peptidase family M23/Bacterial SH3 domain